VSIDQLARDEPSSELAARIQAWKDGYTWLERAFKEIGPGARAASDNWRVRIEDELKTTLDFKMNAVEHNNLAAVPTAIHLRQIHRLQHDHS